jgi:hypothetical protein
MSEPLGVRGSGSVASIEREGLKSFSGSDDISSIEVLGFVAKCCRIVGF